MAASRVMTLTEEQVLWSRSRRWHLAGAGARNAAEAARALIGAQAQQLAPALWALSQRTRARPTAADLRKRLFEEPRTLVRAWGQRETLFLYDPVRHWPRIASIREVLAPGGRRGPMPARSTVDRALRAFRSADGTLCRSDLIGLAPRGYVRKLEPLMGAGAPARRLAAGRLIWVLSLRGALCVAEKVGTEQHYALRERWFPDLAWPERYEPGPAAVTLARDYFRSYGPATVQDLAHFFGARVADARSWAGELEEAGELLPVRCGERAGLLAFGKDARSLCAEPPASSADWPVRLLPLWDATLMGHADKSWTVPDETERGRIWRKGAYVSSVVLHRGRAVATWSLKERARRIEVTIEPLQAWRPRKHLSAVRRESKALADHLQKPEVRMEVV